jgi:hypothetical protein
VKNGVPYDVAFSLPEVDVAAYGIIFNEFDGAEFDFGRWAFKERT